MVVAGILALALALPTGALFGVGYGTGVRIGYEQIYPLLFPANSKGERIATNTVQAVRELNKIYDAIGGKEASKMGIAVGLTTAMSEIDKNPDFQDLLQLEYEISGNTPSNYARNRYGLDNISQSGEGFSDAQDAVTEFNINRKEGESLEQFKLQFKEQMASLSDEKLKDFWGRRKKIYKQAWKQQYITVEYKKRFGNPPSEEEFDRLELTKNQKEYSTWNNKNIEMQKNYLTHLKILHDRYKKGTSDYNFKLKQLAKFRKEFYSYIGQSRNSRNPIIKIEAHRIYKLRPLKFIGK